MQVQGIDTMLTTIGPVHPDGVALIARQVGELFSRTMARVAGLQPPADYHSGYGLPKPRPARAFPRPALKSNPAVSASGTGVNGRSGRRHK